MLSQCAYFNTFYNTKKSFREALQAVEKGESESSGTDSRSSRSRRTSPQRNTSRPRSTQPSQDVEIPLEATMTQKFIRERPIEDLDRTNTRVNEYAQYSNLFDIVIENGSRVLEKYPNCRWVDDTLYILGRAFFYKGEYFDAEQKFRELIAVFPESKFVSETQYWWGRTLLAEEKWEDAERRFRIVLESSGDDYIKNEAIISLAEMLYRQERYDEAIEAYQQTIPTLKDNALKAKAQMQIGIGYFIRQRYEESREAFRNITAFDPDDEQLFIARFYQALIEKESENYDEARSMYQTLLDDRKNMAYFAELRLEIAECLLAEEKLDEAMQMYEDIATIYASLDIAGIANYHAGMVYLKVKREIDTASELLKKAAGAKVLYPEVKKAQELQKALTTYAVNARKIKEDPTEREVQEPEKPIEEMTPAEKATWEREETARLEQIDQEANYRFLMAEVFYHDFQMADSALIYLRNIREYYSEAIIAPKVLYLLSHVVLDVYQDTASYKGYLQELLENYPDAEMYVDVQNELMIPAVPTYYDSAKTLYLQAEHTLFQERSYDRGLALYEQTARLYPDTEHGLKARYFLGWYYENEEGDMMKAFQHYNTIVKDFNGTQLSQTLQPKVEYAERELERIKKEQELQLELERARQDSIAAAGGQLVEQDSLLVSEAASEDTLQQLDNAQAPLPVTPADTVQDNLAAAQTDTAFSQTGESAVPPVQQPDSAGAVQDMSVGVDSTASP